MPNYKKEENKVKGTKYGRHRIIRKKLKLENKYRISNGNNTLSKKNENKIPLNDTFTYSQKDNFLGRLFTSSNENKPSKLRDKRFYGFNKWNKYSTINVNKINRLNKGLIKLKHYGSTKDLKSKYDNHSLFFSGPNENPFLNQRFTEKDNKIIEDILPNKKQTTILYKRKEPPKKYNDLSILTNDNKDDFSNGNFINKTETYKILTEKKDLNGLNKSEINYNNQTYNNKGNCFTYVLKKNGRFITDDDYYFNSKNKISYDDESLLASKLKKNRKKEKKLQKLSISNSSVGKNFFFNPFKNIFKYYESSYTNNLNRTREKIRQDTINNTLKSSKSYYGLRINFGRFKKFNDSKVANKDRKENKLNLKDFKTEKVRKSFDLEKKNTINGSIDYSNKNKMNKDEIDNLLKDLMNKKEKYKIFQDDFNNNSKEVKEKSEEESYNQEKGENNEIIKKINEKPYRDEIIYKKKNGKNYEIIMNENKTIELKEKNEIKVEDKNRNGENEEKIGNNKFEFNNKGIVDIKRIKINKKGEKNNNNLDYIRKKIKEFDKNKIYQPEIKSYFIPNRLNTSKMKQFKNQKENEFIQRLAKKTLQISLPSNNKDKIVYNNTSSSDMNKYFSNQITNLNNSYEYDNKYQYLEDDKRQNTHSISKNLLNNYNYLETKDIKDNKNNKNNATVTFHFEGKSFGEYNNTIFIESNPKDFKPYVSKYPEKVFKKRGLAFNNYKQRIGSKNKSINVVKNDNLKEFKIKKIDKYKKYKDSKMYSYFGDNNVFFEIKYINEPKNKGKEASAKSLIKRSNWQYL